MNTYWFDLEVGGPVTDDHVEALGDILTAADGIDATVQADHRGGKVMFNREAHDAIEAITSAIEQVTAAGMDVTGVTEDLVVTDEIAERAQVTPAAVRYWIRPDNAALVASLIRRCGGSAPACTPGRKYQNGSPSRN